ncbi:MAG TPA: hypothetical protein DIS70_02445 [Anaerolineae bacterium]|nr:hypothetical protein [Anaerolineae bacterium]
MEGIRWETGIVCPHCFICIADPQ